MANKSISIEVKGQIKLLNDLGDLHLIIRYHSDMVCAITWIQIVKAFDPIKILYINYLR